MKKSVFTIYIVLVALTVFSAVVINALNIAKAAVVTIIVLSIVKFWLVAFQFMELKKAHFLWKFLIVTFGIFIGLFLMILL